MKQPTAPEPHDDFDEAALDRALDVLIGQIEREAVPLSLIELAAAVENQLMANVPEPPPVQKPASEIPNYR